MLQVYLFLLTVFYFQSQWIFYFCFVDQVLFLFVTMSDQDPEERSAPGVRNTLVSSIATNIFDTLKSNDDIAAILNGVLDPSRTDKVG